MIVGLTSSDYHFALEVGLGTMEISTRPCQNLLEIRALIEAAVARLVSAAARFNGRVLGYGIQPHSRPDLRIMAPKRRYLSLYRAMGESWLWYTVTAADQLHVALARGEMIDMLNFGSLITPVIIALCADSPVYAGKVSPFCSAREGVMTEIRAGEHRHGMAARPYRDIVDFVAATAQSTYLIVRAGGDIYPSSQPFTEFLREHGPDFEAFLFHEHYIWNSARLRAAYGTIEVRPACQQPWSEHMAASALILGLVEAAPAIRAYIENVLGVDYWERMRTYHQQAIRHGLAAPQPAPNFLRQLAEMAEGALAARGFGEQELLLPVFARLARGLNPAQRARAVFASDGLAGLLAYTTIRPGMVAR
jgi:gamma-glutamylcysteine synthetase